MRKMFLICAWICCLSVPFLIVAKVVRTFIFANHRIVHSPQTGFSAILPQLKPGEIRSESIGWHELAKDGVKVEIGTKSRWHGHEKVWQETLPLDVPKVQEGGKLVDAAPPIDFSAMMAAQLVGYGVVDRLKDFGFGRAVVSAILGLGFLFISRDVFRLWETSQNKWVWMVGSTLFTYMFLGLKPMLERINDHGPVHGGFFTSQTFDSAVMATQFVDEAVNQLIAVCAGIINGALLAVMCRRPLAEKHQSVNTVCTIVNLHVAGMLAVGILMYANLTMRRVFVPVRQEDLVFISKPWPTFLIGTVILSIGWYRLWRFKTVHLAFPVPYMQAKIPFPYFRRVPNPGESGAEAGIAALKPNTKSE